VKSHGLTVELQGKPPVLRQVGVSGTMSGAVKCVDIHGNANGEGS
jgi:hypothetical protein